MERRNEELVASFARVLRRRRKARGLSQEELAFPAGLSTSYISLLETRNGQPTLTAMSALARELGVSMRDLVGEIEDGPRASPGRRADRDDGTRAGDPSKGCGVDRAYGASGTRGGRGQAGPTTRPPPCQPRSWGKPLLGVAGSPIDGIGGSAGRRWLEAFTLRPTGRCSPRSCARGARRG